MRRTFRLKLPALFVSAIVSRAPGWEVRTLQKEGETFVNWTAFPPFVYLSNNAFRVCGRAVPASNR